MSPPTKSPPATQVLERPPALAEFELARHAIVEASAGTGKTYTLEHLVLEFVASGVPIEAILVVTFTDKAAREMKQRVRSRLRAERDRLLRGEGGRARGVDELPEPSRRVVEHVTRALANFDRAQISTIHAFCQRALTEHAFASGRLFTIERIDQAASLARACRAAIARALAVPPPPFGLAVRSALVALEATGAKPAEAFEALVAEWSAEREVRPAIDPLGLARALLATPTAAELGAARWKAIFQAITPWATQSRLREILLALAEAIEPHRAALAARLEAIERSREPGATPLDERSALDAELWGPALAWATARSRERGPTHAAFADHALERVTEPHLAPGVLPASSIFRAIHEQLGTLAPYVTAAALPFVREPWQAEKQAEGALDFDDMLTALRDAIVEEPAVRDALRARYRHALVDEFQDTDEVQWEIFRRLFVDTKSDDFAEKSEPQGESAGSDGDAFGPPRTLILIGDVKQAIYGFRSADVHTFERACRTLEAHGAQRIVLDGSFRSSRAMLEGHDRVLRAEPGEGGDPLLARAFAGHRHALAAGRPSRRLVDASGADASAIVVQHLVATRKPQVPLLRRALAHAIALEIDQLVQRSGLELEDELDGVPQRRALRYSDIFVLTRTGREGLDVAEALRRVGVPHAFFKQGGLFETPEAREILDVLRAIAEPASRSARTRALLGPFFGVSFAEVARAHAMSAEHPFARRLARWSELALAGRFAALFSALLEGAGDDASGLTRRRLYLQQGERSLVNHRHVLELLLELAASERLSIHELVGELEARIGASAARGGDDDEDVQKLESERDAVQLLTMHKSKGLEAEVVFLFGGFSRFHGRAGGPSVVYERGAGDDDEVRRVAYSLDEGLLGSRRVSVPFSDAPVPITAALLREEELELERLYYVAMTRARRRLYLPYVGPPPSPAPRREDVVYDWDALNGPYRVLDARLVALARSGVLTRPPFSVDTIEVKAPRRARAATTPLPARVELPAARPPIQPPSERARLVQALAGFEETSYTRMHALGKARLSRADVHVGATRLDLPPGLELAPGGARFGVLVHGVLEELLRARVTPTEPAEVERHEGVRARFEEAGASAEERALAATLAVRALRTPLRRPALDRPSLDRPGLELPEGFGALPRRAIEMPFLFPIPEPSHPPLGAPSPDVAIERGFVRGVIDLFFEHEGRVWVVDWKTDRLPRYDAATLAAHVEASYDVQRALYSLAALRVIARAPSLSPDAVPTLAPSLAGLHERFGGLLYVFVRGFGASPDAPDDGIVELHPSLEELEAWEEALRSGGDFSSCPLPPRRSALSLLGGLDAELG